MDRLTTKELYSQLQERVIIDLKEDTTLCPECKGLHFIYVENDGKGYIQSCNHCYNGVLYTCKYCGQGNKTDCCYCEEARNEERNEFRLKQIQRDNELYQKAEKINYKDYNGYYLLGSDEHLREQDDLEEWIYEKILAKEDIPEYLWAVEGSPHISIDLMDVIYDDCEDGYEDMFSYLDTKSSLLLQAQDLIDQWEKDQGDSLCIFNETYKKAIIIKDLIEKIRSEINH